MHVPLARLYRLAGPAHPGDVYPVHSLIDQSLHSRLGAETTNGDGFGVGWYDTRPVPGVFRSIEPAWNDQNLRELAGHISSHLFFAHIRAAIGSAVQQTNCHPFRYGRWLFMHNGFIDGFAAIKRDPMLAVDESLFPEIKGTADTEVLFYLAGQATLAVLHPRRPDAPAAVPGPGDLARGVRRRAAGGLRAAVPAGHEGVAASYGDERIRPAARRLHPAARSIRHAEALLAQMMPLVR
jgi:hypothetical protein